MATVAYVRCKACGYIMEAAKLGEVCPACGVPAKQFEPYDDKVSEKRRRLLDLHIHPIVVHLPQAFAAFLLPVGFLLFFSAGAFRNILLGTATVLGVTLPISVAAAFLAGLYDGKLRFRRLGTPVLRRKMLLGSLFFVAACGAALVVLLFGLAGTVEILAFTLLNLVGLGAAVVLGTLGAPLFLAKFPG